MSNIETEEFRKLNKWLGWGEPEHGLWFIGVEEGETWKCGNAQEILDSKSNIRNSNDITYTSYPNKKIRGNINWPVAVGTAKIATLVSRSNLDWRKYREDILWLNESKVFNGNLLSVGKKSLKNSHWPDGYKELFGYTASEYSSYYENVQKNRYNYIKDFVLKSSPQAIVCFGKSHWREFERVFVSSRDDVMSCPDINTKVFEKDKVILTRHFSNGMPDKTIEFIGNILKQWQVVVK